jgi:DNA-binding MarR family transcriptional regulator
MGGMLRTKPTPTGSSGVAPAGQNVGRIDDALQSVARAMNQVRTHDRLVAAAGVELDRAGAALLYRLHTDADGLRLGDLAFRLAVDAPTVTRKVQQLERQGLVSRRADPEDGRAWRVSLTPAGRRVIDRLLVARRAWLERLLGDWSEVDRDRLAALLRRFADEIDRDAAAVE